MKQFFAFCLLNLFFLPLVWGQGDYFTSDVSEQVSGYGNQGTTLSDRGYSYEDGVNWLSDPNGWVRVKISEYDNPNDCSDYGLRIFLAKAQGGFPFFKCDARIKIYAGTPLVFVKQFTNYDLRCANDALFYIDIPHTESWIPSDTATTNVVITYDNSLFTSSTDCDGNLCSVPFYAMPAASQFAGSFFINQLQFNRKEYTVSGTIKDNCGDPISGVDIGTTTTDVLGNYSINIIAGNNITLSPSKSGHTFTSQTLSCVRANTTKDFEDTNIISCGGSNPQINCISSITATPNPLVRGQAATMSFDLQETNGAALSNAIVTLNINTNAGVRIGAVEQWNNVNISANGNRNFIYSPSTITTAAGNYQLEVEYSIDGGTSFIGLCYENIEIIELATSYNLSCLGDISASPNAVWYVGYPASTSVTIQNLGNADYVGDIFLSLHDASTGDYIGDLTSYSGNIAAGSDELLEFSTPSVQTAHGNVQLIAKYSDGNGGYVTLCTKDIEIIHHGIISTNINELIIDQPIDVFDIPHPDGSGNMIESHVITITVLYTSAAIEFNYGSSYILENHIKAAVNLTNKSFKQSFIPSRLQLVHMEEVGYTESGNFVTTLDKLDEGINNGNGEFAFMKNKRNIHCSDLVAIITMDSFSLKPNEALKPAEGKGTFDGVTSATKASMMKAFSNPSFLYELPRLTFTHEIGHNFNCRHPNDISNGSARGYCSINHGSGNNRVPFATVMSSVPACGLSVISEDSLTGTQAYFSNLYVEINNAVIGAVSRNNMTQINSQTGIKANYRNPEFDIQNEGNGDLIITDIQADVNWLSVETVASFPFSVQSNGSSLVSVNIDWDLLSSLDIDVGNLTIFSDDPENPTITFQVTIEPNGGVIPEVEVVQSTNINGRMIGSVVKGGKVSLKKRNSTETQSVGFSDENGVFDLDFYPPLEVEDTLFFEAAHKSKIPVIVDSTLLKKQQIFVGMIDKSSSNKAKHTSMVLSNPFDIVTSNNSVDVIFEGENIQQNQIYQNNQWVDCSEIVTYSLNTQSPNEYLVVTNKIKGRVIGLENDTTNFDLLVDYIPVQEYSSNIYTVNLSVPDSLIGALVYVDEQFVSLLENNNLSFDVSTSRRVVSIKKLGYYSGSLYLETDDTAPVGSLILPYNINVKLKPKPPIQDSTNLDLGIGGIKWFENSTIKGTG